jgi:hypothetical protein
MLRTGVELRRFEVVALQVAVEDALDEVFTDALERLALASVRVRAHGSVLRLVIVVVNSTGRGVKDIAPAGVAKRRSG